MFVNQHKHLPVLDRDYLREISGGDKEFEQEILQLFLEDAKEKVEKMADAINLGDLDTLKSYAHTLKGSSGSTGARQFQSCCKILEEQLLASELEKVTETIDELKSNLLDLQKLSF